MGRSPCCDKVGLKKGPWTPEEDQKLLAYIEEHGHGSWRALPTKAGLQRCGKSCRLRWTNYLRPDIKRGKFSLQEEQTIIQLHALLGNRWSAIATHLPKRTDNEIKNYWNTHLKKRLAKMGIDPVTHKPKNDALLSTDGQSKNAANLSHMAQWESARLEAEARLVRESKLRSNSFHQHQLISNNPTYVPSSSASSSSSTLIQPPRALHVLKSWNGGWPSKSGEGNGNGNGNGNGGGLGTGIGCDLESPTSTLTFSENGPPQIINAAIPMIEFVGTSANSSEIVKEEGENIEWKGLTNSTHDHDQDQDQDQDHLPDHQNFNSTLHGMTISMEGPWNPECLRSNVGHVMEEGFTNLLLSDSRDRSLSDSGKNSVSSGRGSSHSGGDDYEDNKNYWNSILNLVNSSPSRPPMF